MIASNISRQTLEAAAKRIGAPITLEATSFTERRFRVKLSGCEPPKDAYAPCRTCRGETILRGAKGTPAERSFCPCPTCDGRGHNFTRKRDEEGDAPYQRVSFQLDGSERRVAALCWHGFRDFFRAAFELEPEAKFYTAVDRWIGQEDFEERFPASGHRNIGSQFQPLMMADACRCDDRGYAG